MLNEITKLPQGRTDFLGRMGIFLSVLLCTVIWCMAMFSLTLAEHIPGDFNSILNSYYCTQKYSVLFGASVLVDGFMGWLAYNFFLSKKNLIMSKTGTIIAVISVSAFVGFQCYFFFSSSSESILCTRVLNDNSATNELRLDTMKLLFLFLPIIVFRYLIYQPIKDCSVINNNQRLD